MVPVPAEGNMERFGDEPNMVFQCLPRVLSLVLPNSVLASVKVTSTVKFSEVAELVWDCVHKGEVLLSLKTWRPWNIFSNSLAKAKCLYDSSVLCESFVQTLATTTFII